MLFPADPSTQPELWDSLSSKLARDDVALIINQGECDLLAPKKGLSPDEAEALIARMKAAPFCRIGARHGMAINPHFSGVVKDRTVTITDFVTEDVRLAGLQHDFEITALSLLHGKGQFDVVRLPVQIAQLVAEWNSEDLDIKSIPEGIEIRRTE